MAQPIPYADLPRAIRGQYLESEVRSAEQEGPDAILVTARVGYGDEETRRYTRQPGRVDPWTRSEAWDGVRVSGERNRSR
jgi:hypothetical protein